MQTSKGKIARLVIGACIAAALIGWMALDDHWLAVLHAIGRVPPAVIAAAGLGLFATYVLRALRVYEEFRTTPGVAFVPMLRAVMLHNLLVNIVPFRAGEAAFPLLMRNAFGIPLARATGSLIWFRLQDLFVVGALAFCVFPGLPIAVRIAGLAALVALAYAIPRWARGPRQRPDGRGLRGILGRLRAVFAEAAERSTNGWWWTAANWAVKLSVQAWLLAQVMPTSIEVGIVGVLGAETSAILPVQGLAGFGTYEAGAAALMVPYGIVFENGLKGAVVLHLVVIGCALAGGAIALLLPAGMRMSTEDTRQ